MAFGFLKEKRVGRFISGFRYHISNRSASLPQAVGLYPRFCALHYPLSVVSLLPMMLRDLQKGFAKKDPVNKQAE
jgi:hypothetical protein